MRITYVANHDAGQNDDEGAITWALRRLGHEVGCVPETTTHLESADLVLFHKWTGYEALRKFNGIRAFWWFDRVESNDPKLVGRDARRKQWMKMMLPHVDLGFCTDGDWVAKDQTTGKLRWLTQGFDSRVGVFPKIPEAAKDIDILSVGSVWRCGEKRQSFVEQMKKYWGSRFVHVPEEALTTSGYQGVYREELAALISRARIVVAPDFPVSHCYWSNRVYWMLGLGAFLLHPYSVGLTEEYRQGLVSYHNRDDLYRKIDHWLNRPIERDQVAEDGLVFTLTDNTYIHRCAELISLVRGIDHDRSM